MAIRANPNITGIPYAGESYKVSTFADDALLTLTNPTVAKRFKRDCRLGRETISARQINSSKTTVRNISSGFLGLAPPIYLPINRWASSTLDYLGFKPTPSFSANFFPLLRSITALMTSWRFPTLSWIGRVHAVKMTILPKLLYFSKLSVRVPAFYLRLLQNRLLSII